ncbi:late embryogenesis abundant protein Lea5-D-like [Aristolochia californica]|uniref:late embryogenesis abundant protein Lea5-D-like n=1 Tax=Aristolochia californica TaxID=171875 RepID=UPI0035E008AC
MARNLSSSKLLAAFDYAISISSRNLSSAAAVPSVVRGRPAVVVVRPEEKYLKKDTTDAPASWVPDPETGYYRPSNGGAEVDVAELRRVLLKRRD